MNQTKKELEKGPIKYGDVINLMKLGFDRGTLIVKGINSDNISIEPKDIIYRGLKIYKTLFMVLPYTSNNIKTKVRGLISKVKNKKFDEQIFEGLQESDQELINEFKIVRNYNYSKES